MQCAACRVPLIGGAVGHGTYTRSATAASVLACSPACAQQKIGNPIADMDLATAFATATEEQVRSPDNVAAWVKNTKTPQPGDEYYLMAANAIGLRTDAVATLGADVSTPLSAYCENPTRLVWAAMLFPYIQKETMRKVEREQPVIALLIARAVVELKVSLSYDNYNHLVDEADGMYSSYKGTAAMKTFVKNQAVELLVQLTLLNRSPSPFMTLVSESESAKLLDELLSSPRARPFIPTDGRQQNKSAVMKAVRSISMPYNKVKVLMKHGFSPRSYENLYTPMSTALVHNREDIALLLAKSGADPDDDMYAGLENRTDLTYRSLYEKLNDAYLSSGRVGYWDKWGNVRRW